MQRTYPDLSAWLDQLTMLRNLHVNAGWEFVDALRDGIDQFSSRQDVRDLYEIIAHQVGLHVKTLMNYVSVARKFPPERRPDGVEIGHCNALLGLTEPEAEELLHKTVAQGMSVERLRQVRYQNHPIPDDRNECPADHIPYSASGSGNYDPDALPAVYCYEQVTPDWETMLPTVRRLVSAILHGEMGADLYDLAEQLRWLVEE